MPTVVTTIPVQPSEPYQPVETITASPTQPFTETPVPSVSFDSVESHTTLADVIASEFWPLLGLSSDRISAWESFASGTIQPSDEEMQLIEAFLDQWEIYYHLIYGDIIPTKVEIGLFADEQGGEGGGEVVNLYAADPTSMEGGEFKQLYLIARGNEGDAVALVLAPEIQGLSQRPSQDGGYVEYVDEDGDLLLKADARRLYESSNRQKYLKDLLDKNKPEYFYSEKATYPRFRTHIPGVESDFYLIEKLTYNQVLLLISTIQLYDRPDMADMKPFIFPPGDDVEFIISREPHPFAAAEAISYGGDPRQGSMVLYTMNIFDNRYDTAASIAHEAAHIWQGTTPDCDQPEKRLRMEVGDQTIPAGFYDWSAAELVRAAKDGKIGAYHLSVWVLVKFNQTRQVEFYIDVIRTGKAYGISVINCGP